MDQHHLENQADMDAICAFFDKLERHICPTCDQSFDEKVQIGRCVYAKACMHRLYQGTLPTTTKSIADHPFFREQAAQEL